MTAARKSLAMTPAAVVAIGLAAGLASQEAHAFGNEYESLGRTIGGELARSGQSNFSAKGRVLGMIGETLGGNLGRPVDANAEAARKNAEDLQRAREQAARDAAYEAERMRLDPSYTSARYSDMTGRSRAASSSYEAVSANIRAINERSAAAVQDYARRNARPASR